MLAKLKNAPMGWNSWDCYGASATEEIIKRNAEFMAKHLKQYGYEYVVLDIQWSEPTAENHEYHPFAPLCMDEYSRLIPAPNRFPSSEGGKGLAPLAEYIHGLGLKFGIHIMRGIPRQAVHQNSKIFGTSKRARDIAKTDSICRWNTDMYGVDPEKEGAKEYYDSIFSLYASWGIDFIKCDDIAREFPHAEKELIMLADSLNKCGREMVLSLSPGPAPLEKAELFKQTANMWRITDDFWDKWELLYDMFGRAEKWAAHTGGSHYPDADMLPIGAILQDYDESNRTKFTRAEQYTMLTLWSIFRSPLMIGGELTKTDDFTMGLLTNKDILKMHKNARNAHQVWRKEFSGCEFILWTASAYGGGAYAAVFNAGEKDCEIEIPLSDLEIYEKAKVRELWSGQEFPADSSIKIKTENHGARAFKIDWD